jgi:hypothetical protein
MNPIFWLGCYGCILRETGNSAQLWQNFEISAGVGGGEGVEFPKPEIFRTRPDLPSGPPSLLYNVYRVFPGVKRPGRGADYPLPPSAEVGNE